MKELILPIDVARQCREVLDPNGTLPKVDLYSSRMIPVAEADFDELQSSRNVIKYKDKQIGIFSLNEEFSSGYKQPSKLYFGSPGGIWIDKKYRRKHLGVSTYLSAIELAANNGYGFRSGPYLSQNAIRVWQKFVREGLAVCEYMSESSVSGDVNGETLEMRLGYFYLQLEDRSLKLESRS